jgi:chaperonin GroES
MHQPLNDRVLLRRYEDEDDRKVQLADSYKQKSNRGEVLAVGDCMVLGNEVRPIPLKKGDKVVFGEYSAEDITLDGEDLVLISVFDIRLKLA